MTTTIEVQQDKTITPGDKFQVVTTVIDATGIDEELFTYATDTEVFSHVSTVLDILTYPVTRAQAITQGLAYYRQTGMTVLRDSAEIADANAAYTLSRLQDIVRAYEAHKDGFTGSTTYEYNA